MPQSAKPNDPDKNPVWLFAIGLMAHRNGDAVRAAEVRRELYRLGVRVEFRKGKQWHRASARCLGSHRPEGRCHGRG